MKVTQYGIVKQVKIFFLVSFVALFCVTALCDGQIPLKSNLSSMPVINDKSYYDNLVIYKDDTLNNPIAGLVEPIIDEYVNKGLPGIIVLIDEPKSTYYDPDNPFPQNLARGYIDISNDKSYVDWTYFDEACRTPDGDVISCVYDMATFIKAVFHDRHFLTESAFEHFIFIPPF